MGLKPIYGAVSPYPEESVEALSHAQMVDVVYLANINHPVHKLVRHDHADWRFTIVAFGPTIDPPAGVTATATTPNTTDASMVDYEYVATALSSSAPFQESRASNVATVSNDLTLAGNYNTINLPAMPAGVDRYVIYKKMGGGFGYIGYTDTTTFRDGPPPIQPVLSETPPQGLDPFDAEDRYPSVAGLHQQRLVFGGTREIPNGVWLSRTADHENMDAARPARADDALSFAFAASAVNSVFDILSLDDMIVLTSDSVFAVAGEGENSTITPSSIVPKRQSSRGASRLPALVIDEVLFYQPSIGGSIRSMGYSFEYNGYKTNDISIFSSHLFEVYGPVSWAFQREPFSCIWAARADGKLLAFTWQEEHDVWGWTLCETDGFVEQVSVIPEGGADRLYALIRRTINGVERRFFERMALPHVDNALEDAIHLDCSTTFYFDEPQSYVDKLWYLEGATVAVVFDGNVSDDQVVTNGRVDLPEGYEGSVITIGFRYSGRIETLPPALMSDRGTLQGNRQLIDEIMVRTIDTRGIEIGPSGTTLEQVRPEEGNDLNELDKHGLYDHKLMAPGDWKDTSSIVIEQNEPLPARIVGIFASMKVSRS